jgi:hypothetical protein
MSQHVEIEKPDALDKPFNVREGKNGAGREYKIITQSGWLHTTGTKYPTKCVVNLEKEEDFYAPGEYEIDYDKTVTVGDFDALSVTRFPTLKPLNRNQPKPHQQ